jgi:hypothetical protein
MNGLCFGASIAMSNDKLRRQIAYEAARLMYQRQEFGYNRARLTAARRVCQGWARAADLPTNQEIRDQVQALARLRTDGTHHLDPAAPDDSAFDSALDGAELAGLVGPAQAAAEDRFSVYYRLLVPLETVKQNPQRHPEGDALYHSLQVFELAREALPYDEEFQLAALLHDVGKAIDPRDHVAAALEALAGHITERTAWLIEHHGEAKALRDGTLGARARRRLEASDDFDDLMLLCDCDLRGRRQGAQAPDVEEALLQLRRLARENGAA